MHLPSRALRNASQALVAVMGAATERRELSDSLTSDHQLPGQLRLLSHAECRLLLSEGSVGRLGYIARAGTPDIAVVNYAFDGRDVLVRSGPGPKLQAAERGERVVLEVDDLDPDGRRGLSVVVHGTASCDTDRDELAGPTPWAAGPRRHLIRIRPSRLTGRCIT